MNAMLRLSLDLCHPRNCDQACRREKPARASLLRRASLGVSVRQSCLRLPEDAMFVAQSCNVRLTQITASANNACLLILASDDEVQQPACCTAAGNHSTFP